MPHYFDPQEDAPHEYNLIEAEFEGKNFSFRTDSHVFSRKAVDFGSHLLIETILREEKNRPLRLLDLGCGIGVVGLVLADLRPDFSLTMSDVNKRALAVARYNAKCLQVNEANIIFSDGMKNIEGNFDLVALNPPIRAGKKTCYRLYREISQQLTANACLYLVIRVQQGAKSTQSELATLFNNVEILERKKGYRILRASEVVQD